MYQFNRDAIDTTNFSKKHYQELCDFIASEKPFVNDRISYVNGGVSYGGLDYNDNRHHISCNILATPALNEDGKNLNKKEVEIAMHFDGEKYDVVETLSADKITSENYQDFMDFCTFIMEQQFTAFEI